MKNSIFRKIAAYVLLLAFLLLPAVSGDASAVFVNGQWVIFTITNDTLQPLSYYTMPYMHNGSLHVPYSVFSSGMGLRTMYNSEEEVLILSSNQRTLFFDLKNGTAYDNREYGYARSAIWYNGQIYVPARFTAEYFGMRYTYQSDDSILRLTDGSESYSMEGITALYQDTFQRQLEIYQSLPPPVPDPETATPAPVYFMFAGPLNDQTAEILDLLSKYGVRATFFLSADTILENEDLVRRIYVDGHLIGVSSASGLPESPRELIAEYNEANAALFQVLRTVSHLVYLPGGSEHESYTDAYFTALNTAGYRYWDLTIIPDDLVDTAAGDTVAEEVIVGLITVETMQTLALHSTAATVEALPEIFDYIARRDGEILTANQLTTPVIW